MREICFDIEVLRGPDEVEGGWNNPEAMGFGTAVAWDSKDQMYRFYGPNDKDRLIVLLTAADLVIGFNHMEFDYRVIFGNTFDYKEAYERGNDVDLLIEICRAKYGYWWKDEAEKKHGTHVVHEKGVISLDGLAKGTFGLGKSGHGANAPKLIHFGKWAEVFEYNLQDVRLTQKIYRHWITRGYLIDGKENLIRREA